MRFVCNASPLIGFERLQQTNLLQTLTTSLLIPSAVRLEVFGKQTPPNWIVEQSLSQPLSRRILSSRLGPGESEAIGLALEIGHCTLILDDLAARRTAQSLRIPVLGTVGLLVQARQRNLIPALGPFLDSLRSFDFRISDRLYALALAQVGEQP